MMRFVTSAPAGAFVLVLTSCVATKPSTTARSSNLFLLEDLENPTRTRTLAERDLGALRAAAGWIQSFVAMPHKDLGRTGPVCPFVPEALERKTLWLATEQVGGRSASEVVERIEDYKRQFLQARPVDGEGASYKSIVVVFPDLPADRAGDTFDGILKRLSVPSYVEEGLVLGAFHETNKGTAVYNSSFRPFTGPVPFLIIRQAVISDWKFFLDDKDWLNRWARRFGESAVEALAEELRRLPWRAARS